MEINNSYFSDVMVTVIVPIYNAEKYLDKCLTSICSQTHLNLEIILVNDGSTDNSADICRKFKNNDKRIVYIEKENEGQGKARNIGLERMKGKYVSFVDSDDYIDVNMIQILLLISNTYNADMVQCKFLEVSPDDQINFEIVNKIRDEDIISEEHVFDSLKYERILCYYTEDIISCNKLISFDLIKNMRFPENMYYEDKHLMFRLRHIARKIVYLDKYLYYYVQSPNSTMRNDIDKKRLASNFRVSRDLLKYCKDNELIENYNSELSGYFRTLLSILFKTNKVKEFNEFNQKAKCELKMYLPEFKKNKYMSKMNKCVIHLIDIHFNNVYIFFYLNIIRKKLSRVRLYFKNTIN